MPTGSTAFITATACLGCLAGCAIPGSQYVFRPTEQVNSTIAGYPASHYKVPPEEPRGEIDITSFGITRMQVVEKGPISRLLHVRMVVSNASDAGPWTIDAREQLLSVTGEGQSRPAYVNTDVRSLPLVLVEPRQQKTIDLYYTLPRGMQTSPKLNHFEVFWHVVTPGRVLAERTPFERREIENEIRRTDDVNLGVAYAAGWGPIWWYDPFYPLTTFRHAVILHNQNPILVRRNFVAPRKVYVVAPPAIPRRKWY
jgi:hypothetical protein